MLNDRTQKKLRVRTTVHTMTQQSLQSETLAHLQNFDIPVPEYLWDNEPKAITENIEATTRTLLTHVRY